MKTQNPAKTAFKSFSSVIRSTKGEKGILAVSGKTFFSAKGMIDRLADKGFSGKAIPKKNQTGHKLLSKVAVTVNGVSFHVSFKRIGWKPRYCDYGRAETQKLISGYARKPVNGNTRMKEYRFWKDLFYGSGKDVAKVVHPSIP